jgi:hypothetical protein
MVTKAWTNKVTASSRRDQPLLGVLSKLLRKSNIGSESGNIAGIDNNIPDFILRPELANNTAVSHFDCAQQFVAFDNKLRCRTFFCPSLDLCSLLESLLFLGQWAAPRVCQRTWGISNPLFALVRLLH